MTWIWLTVRLRYHIRRARAAQRTYAHHVEKLRQAIQDTDSAYQHLYDQLRDRAQTRPLRPIERRTLLRLARAMKPSEP